MASLKGTAVTAVGDQELLPIASSVSSAESPVTIFWDIDCSLLLCSSLNQDLAQEITSSPQCAGCREAALSAGITSSTLSSCSSIRTEEVQHGSQLPAVYQVPNVCFQPSLLVGRLWNPWCRHLAGCHPRELCHPLLFFPVPVSCQPADCHRDVCHDHWLRGLHRCHQRKQVPPAEFFYHAVNYISVGAHCCDSVLRLHRQDNSERLQFGEFLKMLGCGVPRIPLMSAIPASLSCSGPEQQHSGGTCFRALPSAATCFTKEEFPGKC
ncbi:tetraspanin-4 isoform X3 [Zonotrichia leucophrys gambelii]|uniref:tetraspanin-4 isoform X3 n=1 Tax=Zonotrichia leucophrys gambelii TaxID=257770 RepID=UPI0031408C51